MDIVKVVKALLLLLILLSVLLLFKNKNFQSLWISSQDVKFFSQNILFLVMFTCNTVLHKYMYCMNSNVRILCTIILTFPSKPLMILWYSEYYRKTNVIFK